MPRAAESLPTPSAAAVRDFPKKVRLALRCFGAFLLLTALSTAFVFRHAWFTDNFGVVAGGRVYRIAQPVDTLPALIRDRQLRSVLNLRGGSSDDPWYVAEVRAADDADVEFYDLPMSATRRPKRRELLALIAVLDRCEYPLLIHCKSGADRTGLASALYLMLKDDRSPGDAMRAFSIEYGHFPFGGAETLHEPINEYADWLAVSNLEHTPKRFEGWVQHLYRSDEPPMETPAIEPGPRSRVHRPSSLSQRADVTVGRR